MEEMAVISCRVWLAYVFLRKIIVLLSKHVSFPFQVAEAVAPTPALGKDGDPPLERRTIRRHVVGAANQNWARGSEGGVRGHPVS